MSDPALDRLQGGWQTVPLPTAAAVSFAAPEAAAPNVWRRTLPADPGETRMAQERSAQDQVAVLERLQALPAEMERLVQGQPRGRVSFAAMPGLTEDQRRLLDDIRWLEDSSRRGISFAAGAPVEPERLEWARAWDEFRSLMAQAERLVSNMAWVETELGGLAIARSVVSWSGDARTEWRSGVTPVQAAIHERELAQALRQRQVLIQVVTLTAQSAARLSVTLTLPGGGLLVIPQVWQYVKKMVALVR